MTTPLHQQIPSQDPYQGQNPMNGQVGQNPFLAYNGKFCRFANDPANPRMAIAQTNGHETTCVWFDKDGNYKQGLFPLSTLTLEEPL